MGRDSDNDRTSSGLSRRRFLQTSPVARAIMLAEPLLAAAGPRHSAVSAVGRFELEEATIAELQVGMGSGQFTAHSIAEEYLARIEKIDRGGPSVNSVIEVNPDALAMARSLDRERKEKAPRGPLHGIPVLIKDNIGTADRMSTTAGSLALQGSIPPQDSFVARKLREAGAVMLGKTNLSEWAQFRSSRWSSGWSGRGGLTRNPYSLDRSPCGSSSGSGVAVAANLCAVAVGTDTHSSILCPSSANCIVGIRPTVGLISRTGIIPVAHSQDTAGPMARTVADAVALLTVLAGVDPQDSATKQSEGKAGRGFTQFLDPRGLHGARIGVARKFFGFHDTVDSLMTNAIDTMKRLGSEIIDPADIEGQEKLGESEFEVLLYEFKADLNAYLASLGPKASVHSLKEIIEFNNKNREKEMLYFGQDNFIKAEQKGPLTEKAYQDALEKNHRLSRQEGIDAVMDKFHLDALVAPTLGPPCTTDLVNGDHFLGGESAAPAVVAGYPIITVPAGFVFGLPVGISFFGRAYSEATLVRLAYAFEQAAKFRRPPRFLGHADLHS